MQGDVAVDASLPVRFSTPYPFAISLPLGLTSNGRFRRRSSKTGLTNAIEQIRALQGSDKLIPEEELSPENALLWKVVNKYLEDHPEVAEDRPVDEPLEDLVPELSPFCSYILK